MAQIPSLSMSQKADTAILFFSRTAYEIAVNKVFDSSLSFQANMAIGQNLITHSLNVCKSTNYPVFQYYSKDQKGTYFGERLANAFEDIFNLGYQKVIAVGNDCPFIDSTTLEQSVRQLNSNQIVLGPTFDGGVYLLGMSHANYCRDSFIKLAWRSQELQGSLEGYSTNTTAKIYWLEQYSDIDNEIEFKLSIKRLARKSEIMMNLAVILSFHKLDFLYVQSNLYSQSVSFNSKRGPPLAA